MILKFSLLFNFQNKNHALHKDPNFITQNLFLFSEIIIGNAYEWSFKEHEKNQIHICFSFG